MLLGIIFPLHFFAMYCMFYLLYFVSKSLTLAESGKPASFYDDSGPFFLLWFFPIGIWIAQPRINRLYERHSTAEVASANSIVRGGAHARLIYFYCVCEGMSYTKRMEVL